MEKPAYKIYFSGSITGGRGDSELYSQIIGRLKKYGSVLTDHIGDPNLTDGGEADLTDENVYLRDMAWVRQADVFIAEVSNPSLGVGYEIARAEQRRRPVLCLFRTGKMRRLSAMIAGNPAVKVGRYSEISEAFDHIDRFFKEL